MKWTWSSWHSEWRAEIQGPSLIGLWEMFHDGQIEDMTQYGDIEIEEEGSVSAKFDLRKAMQHYGPTFTLKVGSDASEDTDASTPRDSSSRVSISFGGNELVARGGGNRSVSSDLRVGNFREEGGRIYFDVLTARGTGLFGYQEWNDVYFELTRIPTGGTSLGAPIYEVLPSTFSIDANDTFVSIRASASGGDDEDASISLYAADWDASAPPVININLNP